MLSDSISLGVQPFGPERPGAPAHLGRELRMDAAHGLDIQLLVPPHLLAAYPTRVLLLSEVVLPHRVAAAPTSSPQPRPRSIGHERPGSLGGEGPHLGRPSPQRQPGHDRFGLDVLHHLHHKDKIHAE